MKPTRLLLLAALLVGVAACDRNSDPLREDTKTGLQESHAPKGAPPSQAWDVPSTAEASPNLGTLPNAGKATDPGAPRK